eukprot:SAG22_NODE_385_length_11304_cov_21.304775_1_plen_86_part_10
MLPFVESRYSTSLPWPAASVAGGLRNCWSARWVSATAAFIDSPAAAEPATAPPPPPPHATKLLRSAAALNAAARAAAAAASAFVSF